MAKLDLKHAFRLIPVHPSDWNLLGYCNNNQYYFDVVLPFGLRSSPSLFNKLSDILEWAVRAYGNYPYILYYMDDCFLVGVSNCAMCIKTVALFIIVCAFLGVPVAPEKSEGPPNKLTFLGVELDSIARTISLPSGKMSELLDEFTVFSRITNTTKRDLLSLDGKLSFAAKCTPVGRIFLRRMIDLALSQPVALYNLSKCGFSRWSRLVNVFSAYVERELLFSGTFVDAGAWSENLYRRVGFHWFWRDLWRQLVSSFMASMGQTFITSHRLV